ncbi:hypothetical protein PInf_003451 [Phytophthora infestans]|nr:hypothetical protein PInf_003451 [Phytophthora infestans]
MATQQPARPPPGTAVKPSPLAARTRRSEVATFPRSDLWNWTDDGAKDELIESMLRECVPPMASPPTSLPPPQLQPSSSKNLAAVAAAATAQDGWKAFKVAHRTNKVLSKTRQMINVLTGQNSSKKSENDGEDQHAHDDADASILGDNTDVIEKEETEEMRTAAAAAAKLMEVKAKFKREVLDEILLQ